MGRRSSLLVLGLLASSGAAQVAACSSSNNNDNSGSSSDAGSDVAQIETSDSGNVPYNPDLCTGPLPVMTVVGPDGGQIAPDWSCYDPEADGGSAFFALEDASDDATADAADSSTPTPDAGSDAATADAGPGDAGQKTTDSGSSEDASTGTDYLLHIVDFSTQLPATGATVDLMLGGSTNATPWFTSTIPSSGLMPYPQPPSGTLDISYFLHGVAASDAGAGQVPIYWHDVVVVPPGVDAGTAGNGQAEANSVSTSTESALLTSVFGSEQAQTNLAVIVTAARDCQGRELQGAQLRLIDGATGQDVLTSSSGSAAPRAWYYVNNVPNTQCTFTNNNERALWTMANAPLNEPGDSHVYTLQMLGRKTEADATPVVIGTTNCQLYGGGISVERPYKLSVANAPNLNK